VSKGFKLFSISASTTTVKMKSDWMQTGCRLDAGSGDVGGSMQALCTSYHPVAESDESTPTKLGLWVPGLEMVYASVRRRFKENYPKDKSPLDPTTNQNMLSTDYLKAMVGKQMSAFCF